MEGNDFGQNSVNEASKELVKNEDVLSQFMGRLIIGAVAVVAGYYIYVKFLNTIHKDETDNALIKLILDDPIGKMFNDAKQSMDKKTSEWWESVKQTLLTEELRSALDTIGDVLQQLQKFDSELEIQATRSPLFILLGIIRKAQEEEAAMGQPKVPFCAGDDLKEDDDNRYETLSSIKFNEAKRVAKYAIDIYDASIFGWTEKSVASKLGLKQVEDIVIKDFSSSEHPRYVVLTDHSESNIVLCIRGTYSIGDAILDIVCDEVPFLDGYAHHGMVDGANRILKKVMPVLRSLLLEKFPGYKLRVTGHSLGAGTAELITMILLSSTCEDREWLSKIDIKCVALAPPPVYRPEDGMNFLEKNVQKNILIFVNGNDCVPRLSLANCAWLLAALRAVDNINLTVYDQLSIVFQNITTEKLSIMQPAHTVKENLKKVLLAIQGIDGQYQEKFKYLSHPSSVVYYLKPIYDNTGATISSVSLVRKKAKYFSHILLMFSKMIADHFQWSYEAALDKVVYCDETDDIRANNAAKDAVNVVASNDGSSLVLL